MLCTGEGVEAGKHAEEALWGRGKNVGGNSRVNRVRRQGVNKSHRKLLTEDVEKRWKKCTSGYDRVFRTRDGRKTKCVMCGEVSALFSSKRVNSANF